MIFRRPLSITWRGVFRIVIAACGILAASPVVAEEEPPRDSAAWRKQLESWRTKLDLRKKWTEEMKAIMAEIAAIDDPAAIKPLLAALRHEKQSHLATLYVTALGTIARGSKVNRDSPEAKELLGALVKLSVEPNAAKANKGVRGEAAKQVGKHPNAKDAIPTYIRYLKSKYVTRAAEALAASGLTRNRPTYELPERSLTRALIDGLVQTRIKKVPVRYRSQGWRPDDSLGEFYYHEGYRFVKVSEPIPNEAVRKLLVEYTGTDYGYDQRQWRRWYDQHVAAKK